MIKGSKICGISDLDTLNFIINHPYPPQFIGFICNYKKSSRYVEVEKLNELLKLDKKKSNFVAVLVRPDEAILEEIKHLPFDYYQVYDSTPDEIKKIKQKYNKKIITALTIKDETDVEKYQLFSEETDIYLFDSKGYEKSMSFDHSLIKKVKINKPLMIAGNIQVNDNLDNYKKIADIIDISGGS
jgi:phosphoribosylanthranilate isomerase